MSYKDEIEGCLGEDDVLGCVKKMVVREKGAECGPRLVLLVQPDCVPCAKAQKEYASDIKDGVIEKIGVETDDGIEIVKKNGIEEIPALVALDCHNKLLIV